MQNRAILSQEMTIGNLMDLISNGKVTLLDHQRPTSRKPKLENSRSIIEHIRYGMATPIQIAELQSCHKIEVQSGNEKNIGVFETLISRGIEYSIEDGQHRIMDIEAVFGKFKGHFTDSEIQNFRNATIPICIIKHTYDDLSRRFGHTNNAKQMKNEEKLWNIPSSFNNFLKSISKDEKVLKKLSFRNISNSTPRKLHDTYTKVFKVLMCDLGEWKEKNLNHETFFNFIESDKKNIVNLTKQIWSQVQEDYLRLLDLVSNPSHKHSHQVLILGLYLKHVQNVPVDENVLLHLTEPNSDIVSKGIKKWTAIDVNKKFQEIKRIFL
jgi:hypothetical protein